MINKINIAGKEYDIAPVSAENAVNTTSTTYIKSGCGTSVNTNTGFKQHPTLHNIYRKYTTNVFTPSNMEPHFYISPNTTNDKTTDTDTKLIQYVTDGIFTHISFTSPFPNPLKPGDVLFNIDSAYPIYTPAYFIGFKGRSLNSTIARDDYQFITDCPNDVIALPLLLSDNKVRYNGISTLTPEVTDVYITGNVTYINSIYLT